jgi:hypothetical protein
VADLDYILLAQSFDPLPSQFQSGTVIPISSDQLGVVAEIAQEPVQLPQGLGVAIDAARSDMPSKTAGFEDGHSEGVVGFLCLPTKVDLLHTN